MANIFAVKYAIQLFPKMMLDSRPVNQQNRILGILPDTRSIRGAAPMPLQYQGEVSVMLGLRLGIASIVAVFAATLAAHSVYAGEAVPNPARPPAAGQPVFNQGNASPAQSDFEDTPLSFPVNNRQPMRQSERVSAPSIFNILFYVFLICAFFIAVMWVVKRYMPGHRQFFSHPALEVLGRTHLDQRRYVSLLRVGRRLVVVGVSPDSISPLSEIVDGEEVAEVLELARPKNQAGKNLFGKLFQRHMMEAKRLEEAGELDSRAEALADDISDLRGRMRYTPRGGDEGGIDRTV